MPETDPLHIGTIWRSTITVENGGTYACAGISHRVGVNSIPNAIVSVAVGMPMVAESNEPVDIDPLLALADGTKKEHGKQLKCKIIDTDGSQNGQLIVLDGYITSVSLGIRAGGAYGHGTLMLQLVCQGKQQILLSKPAGTVLTTTRDELRKYILCPSGLLSDKIDKYAGMGASLNMTVVALQLSGSDTLVAKDTSIARQIALAAAAVSLARTVQPDKDFDKLEPDPDALACFGGNLVLDVPERYKDLRYTYFKQLLLSLWSASAGQDMWSALLATLTSDAFLLQLVPRPMVDEENDFRMKIMPVSTWEIPAGSRLVLRQPHILGASLNSNNPGESFTYPSAVAVRFGDAFSFSADSNQTGGIGFASVDTEITENVRQSRDGKQAVEKLAGTLKFVEFKSPAWLKGMLPAAVAADSPEASNSIGSANCQAKKPGATAAKAAEVSQKVAANPFNAIGNSAYQVLDSFAEAMLVHRFRAGMHVTLQLSPLLRHHWADELIWGENVLPRSLEQSLGETIDVIAEFNIGSATSKKLLCLRGQLENLTWECSNSASSSVAYTAQLSRVRLLPEEALRDDSKDVYRASSPLYKEAK